MGQKGRYYEVLGITNDGNDKSPLFTKYTMDTKYGKEPLKENTIDIWQSKMPYIEESTSIISYITWNCGTYSIGFLSKLGTFYDDDFPEGIEEFDVDEDEKQDIIKAFKEQLNLVIDPKDISKTRHTYWG